MKKKCVKKLDFPIKSTIRNPLVDSECIQFHPMNICILLSQLDDFHPNIRFYFHFCRSTMPRGKYRCLYSCLLFFARMFLKCQLMIWFGACQGHSIFHLRNIPAGSNRHFVEHIFHAEKWFFTPKRFVYKVFKSVFCANYRQFFEKILQYIVMCKKYNCWTKITKKIIVLT